jgi:hypothetical protein
LSLLAPVAPAPAQLSALSCASGSVTGGESLSCMVMLTNTAANPVSVALLSTLGAVTVPASVTIPAGSNSQTFTATTAPVTTVHTGVLVAIWNELNQVAVVTVNPGEPPPTGGDGNLIGYWKFDESSGTTAADASGNNRTGTVTGASWTAGKVNSALSFAGTGTSVATAGIPLGGVFSVSAWVNPAAAAQGGYARIAETRYDGGLYLGVNASGTKYKFIVNGGVGASGSCGAAYGCAEGGAVAPGWRLVTATYDGTVGRLYVDGALVASETFTAPAATNYPLYIGRFYASNGYGWNGTVDEFRLYNKALSAAEVAELNGAAPGDGSTGGGSSGGGSSGGDGPNLIGHWKLDEGSGTTTADSSGNSHNGVVSGASWTAGKANGALSFSGAGTGVVTPAISLGNAFSISVWVNPAALSQGGYVRIAETRYDRGLYLGVNAAGTKYKFIVNAGVGAGGSCGAAYGCAEGGTITAGWHLVTATYDGTAGKLYLDGALVATDTFTAPASANLPLYIGRLYSTNGYGWNGKMDDIRLYNKALTEAEVAALYNAGGAP